MILKEAFMMCVPLYGCYWYSGHYIITPTLMHIADMWVDRGLIPQYVAGLDRLLLTSERMVLDPELKGVLENLFGRFDDEVPI